MKYFAGLFLICGFFFGGSQLVAVEVQEFLTESWLGDKDEIWLEMALVQELEWPETHRVRRSKDGTVIFSKIELKPVAPGLVFSSEGIEVRKIELIIAMKNGESHNTVLCERTLQIFYKANHANKAKSTLKARFTLRGPAINLKEPPEYSRLIEDGTRRCIFFKRVNAP